MTAPRDVTLSNYRQYIPSKSRPDETWARIYLLCSHGLASSSNTVYTARYLELFLFDFLSFFFNMITPRIQKPFLETHCMIRWLENELQLSPCQEAG